MLEAWGGEMCWSVSGQGGDVGKRRRGDVEQTRGEEGGTNLLFFPKNLPSRPQKRAFILRRFSVAISVDPRTTHSASVFVCSLYDCIHTPVSTE
jgi:hypothetical protein